METLNKNKKYVLSLDLSTTCSGWAIFQVDNGKLVDYGKIKVSIKGLSKTEYPLKQLYKMLRIVNEIDRELLSKFKKDQLSNILIEEVNLHKSRLSGKTLDGLHWILIYYLDQLEIANRVLYIDSDGPVGWRTKLNLKLTDDDRRTNKERKRLNKGIPRGKKKLPKISKKHLAARYVNTKLGTKFDVDNNPGDNDIVDAIGLGMSYFIDK